MPLTGQQHFPSQEEMVEIEITGPSRHALCTEHDQFKQSIVHVNNSLIGLLLCQ